MRERRKKRKKERKLRKCGGSWTITRIIPAAAPPAAPTIEGKELGEAQEKKWGKKRRKKEEKKKKKRRDKSHVWIS